MKKLIPIFAILLGWAVAAWAEVPGTLTTLRQIHSLSNGEGNQKFPVAFEATVTYVRANERILFVQDEDVAVFVLIAADAKLLLPGDRIQIKGKTSGSFNPIVIPDSITVLHHGTLPRAVPATFEQLIKAQFDCRLVTVRGVVRSADVRTGGNGVRTGQLQMMTESGRVEVNLDTDDDSALSNLLDTEVEITGVSAGKFDDKIQLTGTVLYVPSMANVKILARPGKSPWSVPVTLLDKIFSVYNVHDLTPRVRVQGVITYYQPGLAIVLQDGSKSLWIETNSMQPLRIGDRAEAIGFTEERYRLLSLVDAEVLDSRIFTPIAPRPSTWKQLANWSANQPDGHSIDLVSIEGTVAAEVREDMQDEYVLVSDGRLFSAIYHHPSATGVIPPMMMIPLGTRIRVTGICTRSDTRSVNPGYEVAFDILMRDFDDITVVAKPSMLNIRNLVLLVGLLLVIVALVGGWGWNLERKVRRQTAASAALERQRSRILVDINGSRPLAEILEKIVEMVSSMLEGAPCWCELADGTTVGSGPQEPHSLEIVRAKIEARSGPALGALLAAFGPESASAARRTEALADGVRLATLAIETRRLYTDLRHRSEFDLLTEIPNRFAMEKRMDILIEEARQDSSIFGLIYIDLDEFKQVNDRYGHHIGDLYLQEAAVRMTRQLRGGDMLARLGGDEFAALVSVVNSRADVEEAARRLERCFETPFAVENHSLWGEASIGIALYPEDGLTKDSLLSAADAAMYAVKNSKR
ncbi:MAG: diguanylate cyclase domain-containing protein [Terracidiphilus sp.]